MSCSKLSLGLFGSSHIERYPIHLFKHLHQFNFTINPILISSHPKNIRAILKQNTVTAAIQYIQQNNIHLDYILILIGANDIGTLNSTQIAAGILHIADTFTSYNIQPIITPIFNRDAPWYITVEYYKTERNRINRTLRQHFKKQHLTRILNIKDLHLSYDGVHLKPTAYRVITKSIAYHIQSQLTPHATHPHTGHNRVHYPLTPHPTHHHYVHEREEITIEYFYEYQ